MNRTRRHWAIAGVITLSLLSAACSSDDDDNSAETTAAPAETTGGGSTDTSGGTDTTPAGGGGDLELSGGEVFVTGSSTVEPISVLVAELADSMSGGDLAVSVEGPGTGDGFAKFCGGEADVADASRPIRDEEAQICADAGIEYVELAIAIDGLTVATSPNNADVTCLDPAALYALLGPESEGFDNWSDGQAIATELGSSATLPDAPLDITGPGVESGTYDTLVEFVAGPFAEDRGQEDKFRVDYTQSANDNLIVEGIEATDSSLGWVGYAYYEVEQDRLKAIEIDGGDGCVAPTPETIADGSYPFSRTLYIYVSKTAMADNPAVSSFVDVFLSEDGLAQVTEAGYVALNEEALSSTLDAWAAEG